MTTKKVTKAAELTTTIQIESWRQRLATESKIAKPRDKAALQKMEDKLEMKNTYLNGFKTSDLQRVEEEEEKKKTNYAYDQAKGDEDLNYCKKCKYESKWCKHRKPRAEAKGTLQEPITSTQ